MANSKKTFGIIKVRFHQFNVFSRNFSSKNVRKSTKRIFIPGCSLAGYNKDVVLEMYKYLKGNFNDVDLLMHCCGQPSKDIGNKKGFHNQLDQLRTLIQKQKVQQIIVACENCYEIYKRYLPEVEVTTIWEIIAEKGIPKKLKQHYNNNKTYAIQDPCRIWQEAQIHESVRSILTQLGVTIKEFPRNRDKTQCCGSIHMNQDLHPDIYRHMATNRANSTDAEAIVGYCQSCVNALSITGKDTIHLADFLFNKDVISGRSSGQKKGSTLQAWKNRWILGHYKN